MRPVNPVAPVSPACPVVPVRPVAPVAPAITRPAPETHGQQLCLVRHTDSKVPIYMAAHNG